MHSLRPHFSALLTKIEPDTERVKAVGTLAQEIRDWLQDHDYETAYPHTRLIGSYARHTAVFWIKDVDILVFLSEAALVRTPNAVLLELRRVLEDFPGADVQAIGQHRSIRMEMEDHDVVVDIVPAVAPDGLDEPLRVPDRPKKKWIDSDPLGYMETLSSANHEHTKCLVPFVKLTKTWRDVQMKVRRPKSYMLEVMVLNAVTGGHVVLTGRSWPERLADLFAHWKDKWEDLMDNGDGVPRICDPQLGHVISAGWEREEFETFMRRVRDADRAARRAEAAETEEEAAAEWAKLFGECWPTAEEIEEKAASEAAEFRPGQSRIASAGWVTGSASVRTIPSRSTLFDGGRRTRSAPRWLRPHDRPLDQVAAMVRTFPQFSYSCNRRGGLVWTGHLQPTPDSIRYPIRIVHNRGRAPKVFVPGHDLDPRCRHLFDDSSLCLYWSKVWRWGPGESLVESLVPWSAFWLFYYEQWAATGRWHGPSSPHGFGPEERN